MVTLAHGSRNLQIRLRRLSTADVHVVQGVNRSVVGLREARLRPSRGKGVSGGNWIVSAGARSEGGLIRNTEGTATVAVIVFAGVGAGNVPGKPRTGKYVLPAQHQVLDDIARPAYGIVE